VCNAEIAPSVHYSKRPAITAEYAQTQMSAGGHFETQSDAFSMRVYRSGPPT
jgi:hypothetical protein